MTATSRSMPACSASFEPEHHAARRVQLDRVRVGAEEAVQLPRLRGERVQSREGCVHQRRIGRRRIQREAAVGALDEEGPLGEGGTELRRDREPVLGVEGVIEGAVEGQCSCPALRRGSVDPRWRSGRSPATPDRLRERKVPHFLPLCNTIVVICPTFLELWLSDGMKSLQIRGVARWDGSRPRGRRSAGRRATHRIAGRLALRRGSPLRFAACLAPLSSPSSRLSLVLRRRLRRRERFGR